jgi:hypothetical protein
MLFGSAEKYNYPNDIFDNTRMSFGDHLDELRTRLRLALFGPIIFTILGLLLDGIGAATGHPRIGIGRPMLSIITDPVTTMVRDFYSRRNAKTKIDLLNPGHRQSGSTANPQENRGQRRRHHQPDRGRTGKNLWHPGRNACLCFQAGIFESTGSQIRG